MSLDKFDPGVRISLKKTRDYWKEGRAHLDAVEITVINDGSARLNALISGQIDATHRIDNKAVPLHPTERPRLSLCAQMTRWHAVIAMMLDRDLLTA